MAANNDPYGWTREVILRALIPNQRQRTLAREAREDSMERDYHDMLSTIALNPLTEK